MHVSQKEEERTHCRGITLYLEYQSVCSFVRIGSPAPSSSVTPPPGTRGGHHSLAGEEVGGANSDNRRESLALCLLCGKYSLCLPLCVVPGYSHINIGTILPSSSESIE